jgi:DNA polymerase V
MYNDLSIKMFSIISSFSDNTYQYSIDEAFSSFKNFDNLVPDWHAHGHKIRSKLWRNLKIPVGVGIGSTLTLSKAASFASRKIAGADGVAVIDDEESRKRILLQMKLTDVWGIGNKLSFKLGQLGLSNALELANSSPQKMRHRYGVTIQRTIEELNGVQCLSWDDVRSPKKQIFSTRTLGKRITCYNDLRKALTSHAVIVCNKAKLQNSLISKFYIFIASSPFDDRYVNNGLVYEFPLATDNVMTLSSAIEQVLRALYVEGVQYYKTGCGALELECKDFHQPDLFVPKENPIIMDCYSKINGRFGKGTLRLGSESKDEKFSMRRELLSPRYTTRWSDIPVIQC